MDSGGNEILQTKLGLLRKVGSYFVPIKIWKGSSAVNPVLELFLYRGQYQLATRDAVYSDGTRYRPLLLGFRKLKKDLAGVKRMLVLGAGLGSAAAILDAAGYHPEITFVDIDPVVLELSKEIYSGNFSKSQFIVDNAEAFMGRNTDRFDLVVVDVFLGRDVPEFVTSTTFLKNCREAVGREGHLVLNYMISDRRKWENFRNSFGAVFHQHQVVDHGINRIFVAKV